MVGSCNIQYHFVSIVCIYEPLVLNVFPREFSSTWPWNLRDQTFSLRIAFICRVDRLGARNGGPKKLFLIPTLTRLQIFYAIGSSRPTHMTDMGISMWVTATCSYSVISDCDHPHLSIRNTGGSEN